MTDDRMTAAERQSLLSVLRSRERVAKSDAAEHAAVLLADFEAKLAAVYAPEDHPIWEKMHEAVDKAVAEANVKIAEICREFSHPEKVCARHPRRMVRPRRKRLQGASR